MIKGFIAGIILISVILELLSYFQLSEDILKLLILILKSEIEENAKTALQILQKYENLLYSNSLFEGIILCSAQMSNYSQISVEIIARVLKDVSFDTDLCSIISEHIDMNTER